MTHHLTYTVINPPQGVAATKIGPFAYSAADFVAMFSVLDRATLACGGAVIARADKRSAWQVDIAIEEPACKKGGAK